MSKRYLNLLIAVIIGLLLSGLFLYFVNSKNSVNKKSSSVLENSPEANLEIMTDEEKASLNLFHSGIYEVVTRDEDGAIKSYRFLGLKKQEPLAPDFMSEIEKTTMGIDSVLKVQVLQRDSAGKVMSYYVVENDSEIVKWY
ncbi:MAG: hypothetical protein ACOYL8_03730 [Patescibacteria group bacterium]